MKALIAHNRYRSDAPSGENKVVDAEIELLSNSGVTVVPFIEESDRIVGVRSMAEAALGPVYAPSGVSRFRALVQREQPDVVHIHNVFPLISPHVVNVASELGVPVVQTVHNYRHSCVQGLHFRDGKTCTDCLGSRFGLGAVSHACYRGSRLQSAAMVLGQGLHRQTWRRLSSIIALTPLMGDLLAKSGLPADRIVLRPSWVPDPGPATAAGTGAIFVGRLDEAKGIRLLLEAWSRCTARDRSTLTIVGDGPLRGLVAEAARRDLSIRYLGRQDAAGVAASMRAAGFVVAPSVWLEGYPLVIAEAFAHGRPVVTVAGGAAASILTDSLGWVAPATPRDLALCLDGITTRDIAARGTAARTQYERDNSPQAAASSMIAIYSDVMAGAA